MPVVFAVGTQAHVFHQPVMINRTLSLRLIARDSLGYFFKSAKKLVPPPIDAPTSTARRPPRAAITHRRSSTIRSCEYSPSLAH